MLRRSATVTGLLALTGLFPALTRAYQSPAFEARHLAGVLAALGGGIPVESPLLHLSGPDVLENGASVPLGLSTSMAGVTTLLLLAESNPTALVALFRPARGVESDFSLQVKLSGSSDVYAVAILADGKTCFTHKRIEVVQGACGT